MVNFYSSGQKDSGLCFKNIFAAELMKETFFQPPEWTLVFLECDRNMLLEQHTC